MSASEFWRVGHLSNQELAAGLDRAVTDIRRLTGQLIAYLGEVEERRLHLLAACGSMFEFCVERLGFSEDEACRRIEATRLARRFPALFPLLAEGKLSLSVVALLEPHLDAGNLEQLLAGVSGKSVRKAKEFLAARFPSEDVPSMVRKLPERVASSATAESGRLELNARPEVGTANASSASVLAPVSDPADSQRASPESPSWTDDNGRRCPSRAWLEYDHRQPFGRGGASTPSNLRLLCRAHPRLAAEQAYGRAHMDRMGRKPPQSVRDSRRARCSFTIRDVADSRCHGAR